MPDHVRNPSSYTCYTLDEPVWVGGIAGDLKQQDPWQAAQQVGVCLVLCTFCLATQSPRSKCGPHPCHACCANHVCCHSMVSMLAGHSS